MKQLPSEINEAIRLYRDGDPKKSRELLRNYICNTEGEYDALLWLAKVTPNDVEALTAAQLTYHLDPENEIAQRAIVAVHNRSTKKVEWDPQLEVISFTGMTTAQARAVKWPFRGLQRPIGVLLDEKCIEMRDLGWAAQNAFDEYIKTAARTLLLTYLLEEKAEITSQPIKVVTGVDYSAYIERISSFQAGAFWGLIVAIGILNLGLSIFSLGFRLLPGWIANLASIATLPLLFVMYVLTTRTIDKAFQAKKGKEGESKFLDQIRASLHSPWKIYHNLGWPNRKWGDVDFVLFGPGGIWVFEVKAYGSLTRNVGDYWHYKSRWGWRKMSKHPGLQARRNAVRVKDYLEKNGLTVGWVQPVVIWAGEEDQAIIQDPSIPVWKLGETQDRIEELWRQKKLSDEQISKTDEILQNLIATKTISRS